MCKVMTMLGEARKQAEQSKFRVRLGAVVADGSKIIGRGYNEFRSHPIADAPGDFHRCIHAEIAACLDGPRDLAGADLYVARIKRNGDLACARPCDQCIATLVRFGIRRAHFTVSPAEWGTIRLKE